MSRSANTVGAGLVAAALVCALLRPGSAEAAADPSDGRLCVAAIAAAEPASHLPGGLLNAIGVVESGRASPGSGAIVPWPWTIDVAGKGARFETREDAIAAVRAAQAAGTMSIDVGCMQINLLQHPGAFATLTQAFEPTANVNYAVNFLLALHTRLPDWPDAVAAYHSASASLGAPYAARVAAFWPLARHYGMTAEAGPIGAETARAAIEARIDPNHTLTPEFRAERVDAMLFEQLHNPDLALEAPVSAARHPAPLARTIDPSDQFTPEFRAERIAAAAFDRQRQDVATNPRVLKPARLLAGRHERPGRPAELASLNKP